MATSLCHILSFLDDFRLALEGEKYSRLEADLVALRDQLEKANEGLKAANRLGDQLDAKTRYTNVTKYQLWCNYQKFPPS